MLSLITLIATGLVTSALSCLQAPRRSVRKGHRRSSHGSSLSQLTAGLLALTVILVVVNLQLGIQLL